MLGIPSRKDRQKSKAYEGQARLQSVEISEKSQEVNDLKDFDYNPAMKILNVFRERDIIVLDKSKHPRYSKILGLSDKLPGAVCKVLSEDLVSISYWDTDPPVIKTVPVQHLTLHLNNSLITRVRYSILKVIRSIRIKLKLTMDY